MAEPCAPNIKHVHHHVHQHDDYYHYHDQSSIISNGWAASIQCTMKWKGPHKISCLRNWWGWGPHDDSTEYMDGVKVKVYYICCADGSGGPGGPRSPTIRLFPNLDLGNLLHTYIHIYTFIPTIYTYIYNTYNIPTIYTNIYNYIQIYM